jgi:hypothetical protein
MDVCYKKVRAGRATWGNVGSYLSQWRVRRIWAWSIWVPSRYPHERVIAGAQGEDETKVVASDKVVESQARSCWRTARRSCREKTSGPSLCRRVEDGEVLIVGVLNRPESSQARNAGYA